VKAIFAHGVPYAKDKPHLWELEAWYGATLLRLHQEQLFLEQVGVDERDWEADLPDETEGQPMDGTGERATRVWSDLMKHSRGACV